MARLSYQNRQSLIRLPRPPTPATLAPATLALPTLALPTLAPPAPPTLAPSDVDPEVDEYIKVDAQGHCSRIKMYVF